MAKTISTPKKIFRWVATGVYSAVALILSFICLTGYIFPYVAATLTVIALTCVLFSSVIGFTATLGGVLTVAGLTALASSAAIAALVILAVGLADQPAHIPFFKYFQKRRCLENLMKSMMSKDTLVARLVVSFCISVGARLEEMNDRYPDDEADLIPGYNYLAEAIENNNLEMISLLLNEGHQCYTNLSKYHNTYRTASSLLKPALNLGNYEAVSLLIESMDEKDRKDLNKYEPETLQALEELENSIRIPAILEAIPIPDVLAHLIAGYAGLDLRELAPKNSPSP